MVEPYAMVGGSAAALLFFTRFEYTYLPLLQSGMTPAISSGAAVQVSLKLNNKRSERKMMWNLFPRGLLQAVKKREQVVGG